MQWSWLGIPLIASIAAILVIGLRAPRTRKLAMVGLVPAGSALGACAWSLVAGEPDLGLRVAGGLAAVAGGLAHGVWFSITALPARRVWLRMPLIPLGMWCGTFASLWFFWHESTDSVRAPLVVLGTATLASWLALPVLSRNRGYVESGSRRIPSVRFPCPRCGTRVDWGQGIASCTDCGLFLHIYWPADRIQESAERPVSDHAQRSVRFPCPQCGTSADWERGDDTCASCGLKLSLHWNEHVAGTPPGKRPK